MTCPRHGLGEGDHIKLDGPAPPQVLQTAELRRGDGQWLELGQPEPDEGSKYIVIPYTDRPGVQHKYALTLYTDYEHKFEKVKPRCGAECVQCGNPTGLSRVLDKLDTLEQKYAALVRKEQELLRRGGVSPALIAGGGAAAAGGRGGAGGGAAGDVFAAADLDGDGQISQAELAAYANQVQAHAKEQYDQYLAALKQANAETKAQMVAPCGDNELHSDPSTARARAGAAFAAAAARREAGRAGRGERREGEQRLRGDVREVVLNFLLEQNGGETPRHQPANRPAPNQQTHTLPNQRESVGSRRRGNSVH